MKKNPNKELIEKYPFLRISLKDPNCDSTWLDFFPEGWRKTIAIPLCDDLLTKCQELGYDPVSIHIDDIKEKWGVLTISQSSPIGVDEIFEYYEDLSMLYCIHCGNITKYQTTGWINYICEDCAKKLFGDNKDNLKELNVKEYVPVRKYFSFDPTKGTVEVKSKVPFEKYWPNESDN